MLGNSFFVVHWTNTDGWDPDEPNPKTTYDSVLIAISRVAEDTVGGLVEEFGGIRLCNFELFQKFLSDLNTAGVMTHPTSESQSHPRNTP